MAKTTPDIVQGQIQRLREIFPECVTEGEVDFDRLRATLGDADALAGENAYNRGSANVDTLFNQLIDLAQRLEEEEKRHIQENLSEEELAIFDILTRPGPDLTEDQEQQVKQITRDLLAKLKDELLALDWQKRQRYRAAVRLAIGDMLYDRLPEGYSAELCEQKRDDVYSHVYRNYAGAGESVYAGGA